jgi:hypothetical protein
MPEKLKSIADVTAFTKELKKLLLKYMFYDMHEFSHANLIIDYMDYVQGVF